MRKLAFARQIAVKKEKTIKESELMIDCCACMSGDFK